MLMISKVEKGKEETILKLDGKIEGTYLDELERACDCFGKGNSRTVTLDFSGVTYIDEVGLEMLSRLKDKGIKIVKCSPFIRTLLNDLAEDEGEDVTKKNQDITGR